MKNQHQLLLEQADRKLSTLKPLALMILPANGWISTVRNALRMSLRQFGQRLGISAQSAKEIEQREVLETITLKSLREAGEALNMKFVYGFIPKDGSLDEMIRKRAMELATEIVMRTSQTMKLEDQENSAKRVKKAIASRADEIKKTMPKYLWD